MIALPSIAFGGFSGSAKGVTARQVSGRSILSLKPYPTGTVTVAQTVRRSALASISRAYKSLSDDQMKGWEQLAAHASGKSVFGQKAQISGFNQYVRLNSNRLMAGETLLADAPAALVAIPNVEYSALYVTPSLVAFKGITHQAAPLKLVVKMSGSQSAGISNGWSKTVIISSEVEDDWGEADVTELYLDVLGIAPTIGQKVFVETYWLDTSTGFTGEAFKDSVIVTGEADYTRRLRVTLADTVPEETHATAFDLDFSTAAPVISHAAVILGHSNVASSELVLEEPLASDVIGTSFCIGRGCGDDGNLKPQSYIVYMSNFGGQTKITYAHRGGDYAKPTEVFGPGIIYPS